MVSKALIENGFQGIHLKKNVQCFRKDEGCNYPNTLAKSTKNSPETRNLVLKN